MKWKCSVCGYIYTGPKPPDKCPRCGVSSTRFVKIEEETDKPAEEAGK